MMSSALAEGRMTLKVSKMWVARSRNSIDPVDGVMLLTGELGMYAGRIIV